MASINTGKVIVGGLAAGVVLNVIDYATNMYILGDLFRADMNRLNPAVWANMNDMSRMPFFLAADFVFGIMMVWLYAAIRPRFGAGAGTAIKAGAFMWLFGTVFAGYLTEAGMFSRHFLLYSACIGIVEFPLAAWVGGMLYTEAA